MDWMQSQILRETINAEQKALNVLNSDREARAIDDMIAKHHAYNQNPHVKRWTKGTGAAPGMYFAANSTQRQLMALRDPSNYKHALTYREAPVGSGLPNPPPKILHLETSMVRPPPLQTRFKRKPFSTKWPGGSHTARSRSAPLGGSRQYTGQKYIRGHRAHIPVHTTHGGKIAMLSGFTRGVYMPGAKKELDEKAVKEMVSPPVRDYQSEMDKKDGVDDIFLKGPEFKSHHGRRATAITRHSIYPC